MAPKSITAPQAEALAALLHQLRPEWAHPAIMAALRDNWAHPAPWPVLAEAAVKAARNPRNLTPRAIYFHGPHWPPDTTGTRPVITNPCPDHRTEPADRCRCCAADVLTGDRPPTHVGRHYNINTQDTAP